MSELMPSNLVGFDIFRLKGQEKNFAFINLDTNDVAGSPYAVEFYDTFRKAPEAEIKETESKE